MALEGVKKGLRPSTPNRIEITISIATTSNDSIEVAIPVAIPATASENAIAQAYISIRSASVQAAIARVMTVNKLSALLIQLRDPAATALTQSVS
jgi:hypothetical protein